MIDTQRDFLCPIKSLLHWLMKRISYLILDMFSSDYLTFVDVFLSSTMVFDLLGRIPSLFYILYIGALFREKWAQTIPICCWSCLTVSCSNYQFLLCHTANNGLPRSLVIYQLIRCSLIKYFLWSGIMCLFMTHFVLIPSCVAEGCGK